jgi:hypothetical protein
MAAATRRTMMLSAVFMGAVGVLFIAWGLTARGAGFTSVLGLVFLAYGVFSFFRASRFGARS